MFGDIKAKLVNSNVYKAEKNLIFEYFLSLVENII